MHLRYDADGSGELEESEFVAAVRTDLAIDQEKLTSKELKKIFAAVIDTDGSGSVRNQAFALASWVGSINGDRATQRVGMRSQTVVAWAFIF